MKQGSRRTQWFELEPLEGVATTWQCDSMARALDELDCEDFYQGEQSLDQLGLNPPLYTLTAERGGDNATVLHLGEKIGEQYPVMLPGEEIIWLIPSFRGDYFTKAPEDYLQDPPVTDEPETPAVDGVEEAAEDS